MTSLLELGITSQQQAAELERDLGVRFVAFTPEDCETWNLQTAYLDQFSRTRAVSLAADKAGISIRTARQWQAENALGFNNRLELAVLRYTDVLEVMLLQRTQEPDSPPSLLMMLLRAHMPEKYGSARRGGGAPRDDSPNDHHCDHDPQPNSTSQYDQALLEEIFRELQNLRQFAGLTEPPVLPPLPEEQEHGQGEDIHPDLSPAGEENTPRSDLSPAGGETQRGDAPTPSDQAPAGPGLKPAPDASTSTPSPVLGESLPRTRYGGRGEGPAPNTQNLNRRQRRELQRRAKRQKSHLARAPN